MILLVSLFSGSILSTIFPMCLRGMGQNTKLAAAILVTASVGGAPFPVIQNYVHDSHNGQYAVCIMVAALAGGAVFPVYVNVFPAAMRQVERRDYKSRAPHIAEGEALEVTCSGAILHDFSQGGNGSTVQSTSPGDKHISEVHS